MQRFELEFELIEITAKTIFPSNWDKAIYDLKCSRM